MRSNKSSRWMVILAGLSLLVALTTTATLAEERYEEKFTKTVALAKDGTVDISNITGSIEVKSWDKAEVKIDALKISRAGTLAEAKENAAEVEIVVEKMNETVKIKTEYPKQKFRGKSSLNVVVDYNLWVPSKASARINNVTGEIVVGEIGGKVNLNLVTGSASVKKVDKEVDCNVVTGSLKVHDVSGDAYLNVTTGDIDAERIKGIIKVKVVTGEIDLNGVSEARIVEGATVTGSIKYQGRVHPEGRYSFNTTSGDIKMVLPADSSFELKANTFSGDIETDFKLKISGKFGKRTVEGVVNKGGATVKLNTFSGDIILKKE